VKGKVIANKYRISEQLGLGGMGVVYRARHLALERDSAIKLLHPQLNSDSTFVERFMREARAMARLDHENIIRIYDVFQDDQVHLIAMELFDGISLRALIEKGEPIPITQAISIVLQCARGLAYAHAQGIVHRDIKPSNIMINAQGQIKITDFGIAAAVDDSASLTSTGQLVGTPRYMSPEQARNEPVDRRSDIYALGMVAYELVTGLPPFEGESGVSIIGKLAYETNELNLIFPPRVPEQVQSVIRKMVARSADDRYSHATHLMQALKSILETLEHDSTLVLPVSASLTSDLELEPRFADTRYGDPPITQLIKNPPAKINSGSYAKPAKKTWTKGRIGKFAAAASIVLGIGIGTLMVVVNPELDFNLGNFSSSREDATAKIFNQLLQLEKQTQQQKLSAQDWHGDTWAPDVFSRGVDKELIASQSITAIRRHIEKQEEDAADRDIKTATLLMKGALDLYREAERSGRQSVKDEYFSALDELKHNTAALSKSIASDNMSQAELSSYKQANKAVSDAETAYLQFSEKWTSLSRQEAELQRDETKKHYQLAFNLLNGMRTVAQQEDVISNIYAIRDRLRELRGAISIEDEKARQHRAEKFSAAEYGKAKNLKDKLDALLVDAEKSLKSKDYSKSGENFEKSIQVAEKAVVQFQYAAQLAIQAENQSNAQRRIELAKIEAEKKAREQELAAVQAQQRQQAQQMASTQTQQVTQQMQQQHLALQQRNREQNQPLYLRAKPSQKDVVAVENMLSNFKQAIEQRNLEELRKIADLSDNHLRIVTEVFNRFNEVHLSVTSYALSRTGATASFRFDKLVTATGDDVLPSANWRNGKLEMVFSDKGWEKIRWY